MLGSREKDVKELAYRCEFLRAVQEIDQICAQSLSSDEFFSLQLLKVQSLFELKRTDESQQLLKELASSSLHSSVSYLYTSGKMAYMNRQYDVAEQAFLAMIDESESVGDYFKALLGITNTYYTLGRYDDVKRYFAEFEELSDVVPLENQISYLLLKANVLFLADRDTKGAVALIQDVIRKASRKAWSYFIIKGIYVLATIHEVSKNHAGLAAVIDVLKAFLMPHETLFLNQLVEEKFGGSRADEEAEGQALKFDLDNKRIFVTDKWLVLHDKPLIFHFIHLLSDKSRFVTKKEIARHLWPDQAYQAKTHDPRIFDIARRVRGLFELAQGGPFAILSGRMGYKLAFEAEPASGRVQGVAKDIEYKHIEPMERKELSLAAPLHKGKEQPCYQGSSQAV
jgi:tetratricopeptide (TPR) repeat protein